MKILNCSFVFVQSCFFDVTRKNIRTRLSKSKRRRTYRLAKERLLLHNFRSKTLLICSKNIFMDMTSLKNATLRNSTGFIFQALSAREKQREESCRIHKKCCAMLETNERQQELRFSIQQPKKQLFYSFTLELVRAESFFYLVLVTQCFKLIGQKFELFRH